MKIRSVENFLALAVTLSALPAHFAHADSSKIRWEENGHDYQMFNSPNLNWWEAKAVCESKGGYLATLTSAEERLFVVENVSEYGYIGAIKPTSTEVWGWITGEKFQYSFWGSGEPGTDAGVAYMTSPSWENWTGSNPDWYICEFAPNAYLDVSYLPDINGNGSVEQASLYVSTSNQKINIDIKDTATKERIKQIKITNLSTLPPVAVAPVTDVSGDGVTDIAVLFSGMPSNRPYVNIYNSVTGGLVKSISYLSSTTKPIGLRDMPDSNANGSSELTVLGVNVNTDKATAETRDPVTGTVIFSIGF